MGRETSIKRAVPTISELLELEAEGRLPRRDDSYNGSEILDRQHRRKIDQDIKTGAFDRWQQRLPSLPKGYSWVEQHKDEAGGEGAVSPSRSVLTPDGSVISPEEVERHLFVSDRSYAGRNARVRERMLEGFRDATSRKDWGLDPENQESFNKFFGRGLLTHPANAIANIGAGLFDLATIPAEVGIATLSQSATEAQDALHLPTWKYGTSRPKDLWEAGGATREDWMEIAPVATAPLGGLATKVRPQSMLTRYQKDIKEALEAGRMLDEAEYLAQPYKGRWHHHFMTSAEIREAIEDGDTWAKAFGESKWNKWQPKDWSRLEFYKHHGRVDKDFHGARMRKGMEPFRIADFGVEKYGTLGRFWHGAPPRSRALMALPPIAIGGAALWEEINNEPKIPPERY